MVIALFVIAIQPTSSIVLTKKSIQRSNHNRNVSLKYTNMSVKVLCIIATAKLRKEEDTID